jgi:hypothetical protein
VIFPERAKEGGPPRLLFDFYLPCALLFPQSARFHLLMDVMRTVRCIPMNRGALESPHGPAGTGQYPIPLAVGAVGSGAPALATLQAATTVCLARAIYNMGQLAASSLSRTFKFQ